MIDDDVHRKPDPGPRNPLGLDADAIDRGLDVLRESRREWRRMRAEKPDRPVKPLYPPDADVPNPQGLSTAEINEGLAILAEANREWKRLQAEKAAREQPG